jgi:thiamine pyrophosphate-dependent acetolactate synthase large subunit-like protein
MVLLTGDGAWAYCLSEFETAVRLDLDLTCVVLNNKTLGWIAHIEARREQPQSTFTDIDFAATARAMGGTGIRTTTIEETHEALLKCLATPGPCLIDVQSSADASPILPLASVSSASHDAYVS